jgi:diguanylate cyclase (GGDEF)-like protein/PAS domain S-box-containing protein
MPETSSGAEKDHSRPELAAVADRLLSPVVLVDDQARIAYVNPAAALVLRQEVSWLLGRDLLEMVHPTEQRRIRREWQQLTQRRPASLRGTLRLRPQPNMDWRRLEWTADNVVDVRELNGILVSLRDITEQEAERRALDAAAHVDSLTGLPNRARISEDVARLMTAEEEVAVAFLGVDRMTMINDSLGHASGDRLLQLVARRLRSSLPAGALLGRFNGNGFVVVLPAAIASNAAALAWGLVERMRDPLYVAGHELRLSLSVGLARRDASSTAESLFSEASLALRSAKGLGGGRVESYAAHMRELAAERLRTEADLRRAISHGELRLALQPIVRLADTTPVGAEALVRWTRNGSPMDPAQFIEIAESSGLIVPLGEWVITEAGRRVAEAPGAHLSVNLSARELASPHLIQLIDRVISERGIPRGALSFEITETLLMTNFEHALEMMSRLRRSGSRVGLDDFGAGYSSLGYVRRLPIDFIKLDRKLIEDVDVDSQARAIVGAVIAMARALGIEVIAEGIERPAQADVLAGLGADLGQGYLFGRPV